LQHGSAEQAGSSQQLVQLLALPPRLARRLENNPRRARRGALPLAQQAGSAAPQAGSAAQQAGSAAPQAGSAAQQAGSAAAQHAGSDAQAGAQSQLFWPRRPLPAAEAVSANIMLTATAHRMERIMEIRFIRFTS
jgi:hypothetical protein